MSALLAAIGIHHARHRPPKRAIVIGEKFGIYRDDPCSKGLGGTSPFAQIWINEMVKRQG